MTFRRVLALVLAGAFTAPVAFAQESAPTPPQRTLTKAPVLVTFVEADYPAAERAAGTEASVVLQLDIDAKGAVTAVRVVTSAGAGFDAAALAAVQRFVFSPAEIDGTAAPIRIEYQYDFKISTQVEAPTTAELAGVVRDHATGAPLAGVTLVLDDGTQATTGADGTFAFAGVVPGTHAITLSSTAITPLRTEEILVAGKHHEVVYDVSVAGPAEESDGDDLEIVVTAPVLTRAAAAVEVAAGVARRVPGTGGDVLRVVENMPGVARAAAGSGQLVVWGAAPEDTRVYVDGVRVPRLYHLGGVRSIIAADLVRSIELVPGGWGAAYGRSLGGLVTVGLAPLTSDVGGSVAVDAFDAAGTVHAPIGERVRVAAALRRSHLAGVLSELTDEEISELFPVPRYFDGQVRAEIAVAPRARVELVALGSTDRVTREVTSSDPAMTRSDEQELDFWRAWARYHSTTSSGAEVDVVASGGTDHALRRERFGAAVTSLETDAGVYGLRTSWRQTRGRVGLEVGLDGEIVSADLARTGAVTMPAREGDVRVFGQPPPDRLAADRWSAVSASAAPYVTADVALWNGRVHVVPGLRVEPFVTSASRRTPIAGDTPSVGLFAQDVAVQPRLAVRASVTSRVTLTAAAGRYRQPPSPADLSAVFGSPELSSSTGTHVLLGGAVTAPAGFGAELTVFATTSSGLAVRSGSDAPPLAQVLAPDGEGRVVGAQALVRRDLGAGVGGWVSYTLSRSERTDGPGMDARAFDYDQTHVLTALASRVVGAGVEVGARVRLASGAPRTPVIGSYYDTRAGIYQPIFGEHNSTRLPAFAQLDVRIAKQLEVAGGEGEIYLDVQNVTDRDNVEEVVYSADFTQQGTIRGLPFLPVLGARMVW